MSNSLKINSENFQQEVLDSKIPVLADFAAQWCGPCKRLAPVIDEIAAEMGSKIKVVAVDIDDNQDIASEYNILSVPTLIIFKNGKEISRNIGLVSKNALMEFINSNI